MVAVLNTHLLAGICISLCHQLSLMHLPLLPPTPEAVHMMVVNGRVTSIFTKMQLWSWMD